MMPRQFNGFMEANCSCDSPLLAALLLLLVCARDELQLHAIDWPVYRELLVQLRRREMLTGNLHGRQQIKRAG